GAITPAGKPLSIGGTGISGAGALIYTGTSGWGGAVALTADTLVVGTGTCTVTGALSGAFNLTKQGSGTLTLNGNSSGYAGTIAFTDGSSGKIVAGHNNALGTAAGITVISGDILELASASIPVGKTLTIAGNGGGATVGALRFTGAGNGWAGGVTLSAATTIGGTGSGTISGAISGAFNLTKCDTGTLTLSGDNSGYANAIAFQDGSSGRIVATHNNALGTAGSLTVTSGDTLELNGAGVSGKTLTLSGVGDTAAGCFITTGSADAWSGAVTLGAASSIGGTGAGTISGAIGGAFGLTKLGTGSWTLTSGSNAYTTSTINAGTLAIISPGIAGTGAVTVNTGGILAGTGTVDGAVTVAGGAIAPGTVAGSIGTLTLSSSLGGTSGSLAMGLSGASADQIVVSGSGTPVTFTNLVLALSGTLSAPVSLITFANGTNATTFSSVTGKPSNCSPVQYLTNSVDLAPAILDLVWTGSCTGSGTTTNRIWALGNLVAGRTPLTSESGSLWYQVFELQNNSDTAVDITITGGNAVGGTAWTNGASAGADQFVMEMKPAAGA
ncbi:MAG: autotransporter-associated beta strand repeat-containing protein, partial [Planctomycetota bacterium]